MINLTKNYLLTFEDHINNLLKYHTQNTFIFELKCIKTKQNIKTPARGKNCNHLEAYEYEVLINMSENFKCS